MAQWKKVIVSGSNAHLNHITASGNISASGFLFGNLPEDESIDEVVVYNPTTGRLEFKTLNLVNAQRAPHLFLLDIDNSDLETQLFRLSFDSSSQTQPINCVFKFSASMDGGSTFPHSSSVFDSARSSITASAINDIWFLENVDDEEYFNPATDGLASTKTGSFSRGNINGPEDVQSGLLVGSSKQDIILHLQATDSATDFQAVPAFTPGPAYVNRAFEANIGTDTGSIEVYLNNTNTPVATFHLTGSNNPAITTEVANIVPDISPSGSAKDTSGAVDKNKTFRSGSITIQSDAQRDGYNFAYVFYTGSRGTTQVRGLTNFAHWFYDNNGAGQNLSTVQGDTITSFNPSNTAANTTASVSGIKFFISASAPAITHKAHIQNFYKNIYPTSDGIRYEGLTTDTIYFINLIKTGSGIDSNDSTENNSNINTTTETFDAPKLVNKNNAFATDLRVTASIGITFENVEFHQPSDFEDIYQRNNASAADFSNEGDAQFRIQFDHISGHKTNSSRQGSMHTIDDFLINRVTNTSNEHEIETFRKENFRLQSQSAYTNTTQANINSNTGSILAGTYDWNSEKNVVSSDAAHQKGLIYYYSHLYYPTRVGDISEASSLATPIGPTGQPTNYDNASGLREFYRYFKLKTAQAGAKSLSFELIGSGSVVREADTTQFATNKAGIKMYLWRSRGNEDGNSSACTGQFVNVIDTIRAGNGIDNDNKFIKVPATTSEVNFSENANTLDSTGFPIGVVKISDANGATFKEDEVIMVKILVPENWAGRLDALLVRKGNPGSGTAAFLGDSSNSGVDADENYGTDNL